MAAPCALFASSTDTFHPDEFIKLILNTDTLPSAQHVTESVKAYDWHIDTKYYTADVNLCISANRTIGNQEFAQAVQAFVVYFDPKEESTFELTKAWLPYLEQIEPDILILACDNCSHTDAVSRLSAQKWCIDNCFELVELNPVQDNDNDDLEDDFVETTGVKRIIQALHAHTWPNLTMKDNPVIGSSYYRQLLKEESELKANEAKSKASSADSCANHSEISANQNGVNGTSNQSDLTDKPGGRVPGTCDAESGLEGGTSVTDGASGEGKDAESGKKEDKKLSKEDMIDSLLPDDDMALLAALGNEDPGEESFEQMFEKLRVMKEKAESLPPEQRKMYAEKIAVSFWKAIGGDEDEIEGLDDSDTELQPS